MIRFSTSSMLNEASSNDNESSTGTATSTNTSELYSTVNVKVKPKNSSRNKIDYTQSYTANNFITPVRAFNEFLLRPKYAHKCN